MIRDKEWLKKEIKDKYSNLTCSNWQPEWKRVLNINLDTLLGLIDQLDEPETLSQKWVEENKITGHVQSRDGMYWGSVIPADKLMGALMPKKKEATEESHEKHGMSETRWKEVIERYKWHLEQEGYAVIEKPTVPQFVGEWIEYEKKEGLFNATDIRELIKDRGFPEDYKIRDWFSENKQNDITFMRAWLVGYTVEDKKYYVLDAEDIPLLERANNQTCKTTTALSIHEDGRDNSKFELTEQEIKDYDDRFLAFAVPVEEEEE